MVTAGKPVDSVIQSLKPLLEEGDVIMDGGNSHYEDTERRYEELKKKGSATWESAFPAVKSAH